MPRNVPSYRQRKGYDQALVTLRDARTKQRRDYWLGTYNTAESRERYHRLIAEWEANGRRLPDDSPASATVPTAGNDGPTVAEMILAYWRYVESYYQPTEAGTLRVALRMLRRLYGQTPATTFGPKALRLLRQEMVRGDEASDGNTVVERIIRTKPHPTYEAGDRTGRLPESLPLNFEAFAKAFASPTSKPSK